MEESCLVLSFRGLSLGLGVPVALGAARIQNNQGEANALSSEQEAKERR